MWVCSHRSQSVSYSFTLIVRSAFWKSLMLFIYLASFLFFILFFSSAQFLGIFQLTHIWHWVRQTWFLCDFCMVNLIGINKESKTAKNVARARRSVYFLWVVRVHSTIGSRFTIVSFSDRCTYKTLRLHVSFNEPEVTFRSLGIFVASWTAEWTEQHCKLWNEW